MNWQFSLRGIVRKVVNGFGYDIVRYRPTCDHPLNVLNVVLRERLARNADFFFIQVGANDGVRSDPLRPLILEKQLPGLLIEPLPDQFARLRENYLGQSELIFENCAIAETDGQRDLFRIQPGAEVPDWAHGIASFDHCHLDSIPDLRRHVETIKVPTRTFASVLEKHEISNVTILVVDTEGFDAKVVKLALEAGLFPEMIYYEHCHLSSQDYVECRRLLKRSGYCFTDIGRDTLAIQTSAIGAPLATRKIKAAGIGPLQHAESVYP